MGVIIDHLIRIIKIDFEKERHVNGYAIESSAIYGNQEWYQTN